MNVHRSGPGRDKKFAKPSDSVKNAFDENQLLKPLSRRVFSSAYTGCDL